MAKNRRGNLTVDDPLIQEAIRKGLVVLTGGPPLDGVPVAKARKAREPDPLVAGGYDPATGVWLFPVRTASEANARAWREKNDRNKKARYTVSFVCGRNLIHMVPVARAFHAGRRVDLVFTRLGGKRLDAANLGSSMKGTEDAFALILGADDGKLNWHSSFEQDTDYDGVGVSVTVRIDGLVPVA